MFITTSRKANNLEKKVAKYFSIFLPNLKLISRGKTPLKKLFEKSCFLGFDYFVKLSKNKSFFVMEIYKLRKDQYFLNKKYVVDLQDINHKIPLKEISKINYLVYDQTKKFSFLNLENSEKESDYKILEEKGTVGFYFNEKDLGFCFKIYEE
jgi:hypothetical protein